jgi:hypothetical protein
MKFFVYLWSGRSFELVLKLIPCDPVLGIVSKRRRQIL